MLFSWGFLLCVLLSYGLKETQSLNVPYVTGNKWIEVKDRPHVHIDHSNDEAYGRDVDRHHGHNGHNGHNGNHSVEKVGSMTGGVTVVFSLWAGCGEEQNGGKKREEVQRRAEEAQIQGADRFGVLNKLVQAKNLCDDIIELLDV